MNNTSLIGKISLPKIVTEEVPMDLTKDSIENELFMDVPKTTEISEKDQFVVCQETTEDSGSPITVNKRIPADSLRSPLWMGSFEFLNWDGITKNISVPKEKISGSSLKIGDVGILLVKYDPEQSYSEIWHQTNEDESYYRLVYGKINNEISEDEWEVEVINAIDLPDFTGLNSYINNNIHGPELNPQKKMYKQDEMLFCGALDTLLYRQSISDFKRFLKEVNPDEDRSDLDIVKGGFEKLGPVFNNQIAKSPIASLIIYDPDTKECDRMTITEFTYLLKTWYGFVVKE